MIAELVQTKGTMIFFRITCICIDVTARCIDNIGTGFYIVGMH